MPSSSAGTAGIVNLGTGNRFYGGAAIGGDYGMVNAEGASAEITGMKMSGDQAGLVNEGEVDVTDSDID